jgi:hypothetical protein
MYVNRYRTGDAFPDGVDTPFNQEYFSPISSSESDLIGLSITVGRSRSGSCRAGRIWIFDYAMQSGDFTMLAGGYGIPILKSYSTILANQKPVIPVIPVVYGSIVSVNPPRPIPFKNGIFVVMSKPTPNTTVDLPEWQNETDPTTTAPNFVLYYDCLALYANSGPDFANRRCA